MTLQHQEYNVALDLASIKKLTNLNDINRLLHEALSRERAIDLELEQLLSRRTDVDRDLLKLHASTGEVSFAISIPFPRDGDVGRLYLIAFH